MNESKTLLNYTSASRSNQLINKPIPLENLNKDLSHSPSLTSDRDNDGETNRACDTTINMSTSMKNSRILESSFSQMQDDLDRERLLGGSSFNDPYTNLLLKRAQHQENYEKLLKKAHTDDLNEISGIGCLYQSGYDRYSRPVIILVGKWFPFKTINLEKTILYIISLLDTVVKKDYIVIYFHTLTSNSNYPTFSWLSELYNVLPYKYKKNLKAFYIVHPTIWTKMTTWWFTTFIATSIKKKVHNITGLEYLYSVINRNELEIPAFITEHDMTINGTNYIN